MTANALKVALGTRVEMELVDEAGKGEHLVLTLVPEEQADLKSGWLSINAPLAQAVLGRRAGETLPYEHGDLRQVHILAVHAGAAKPTKEAAARRKAAIRKAIQYSDYVNAMIFAGAVNSKWGDYDIDKLDPAQWGQQAETTEPD